MWTIVLNDPPVPKARPRFTKSGHTYTPTATQEAEHRLREAWRAQYPGSVPTDKPVELLVYVYVARPSGHFGTGRNSGSVRPSAPFAPAGRPDIDNYLKTVLDALNGVAWRDDGQVIAARVSKHYADGDCPIGWYVRVCISDQNGALWL